MSGIYYGLFIVAVFVVIRWLIANEKTAAAEPTKGLLGVKPAADAGKQENRSAPASSSTAPSGLLISPSWQAHRAGPRLTQSLLPYATVRAREPVGRQR